MKAGDNVVPIVPPPSPEEPANDAPGLAMPRGFAGKQAGAKALREAWDDLMERSDRALQTADRSFDFEMAARLMARFRAGELTSASEFKELKRLMVALGLSKGEDGEAGKKGKLSKYVTR